jgi:hypothetical protein
MIDKKSYAAIRAAATHLAAAGDSAVSALADGRTQQEPAFTDRMLGQMEHAMKGYTEKGIRWSALTLTDRGPNTQEQEFGADFAGVLDVDLEDVVMKKGFLAQAKKIEPKERMSSAEKRWMIEQCEKMLEHSSASFVFLYSIKGVVIAPAISVVDASFSNPHELYSRKLRGFYEAHFECFIGDKAISGSNRNMLELLRERLRVRKLSYLRARRARRSQALLQ